MTKHEIWMQHAYKEAENAYEMKEIPIGAVVVFENRIIGKGYNQVETLHDPTAHAEIIAITSAAGYLSSKVLLGCTMYVTLEPCSMCAGAIVLSKMEALYFGAFDNKSGACGSVLNITNNSSLNHSLSVTGGIMHEKCGEIIRSFFEVKR
ncbi:MAG: tRNA adenosine(34) deaminase TadA [Ignavibacteria bacterium]|nr:tRNA adenosine(34) deaminase TadA [Ignavibacteria bacterium]